MAVVKGSTMNRALQIGMRSLEELVDPSDSGWIHVLDLLTGAVLPTEVLAAGDAAAGTTLFNLQVTTRSPMGGIAYHAGAIQVAARWITVLGSADWAHAAWNGLATNPPEFQRRGFLIVAFDALGGVFAVDGGGLGTAPGKISYFGPRELAWLPLNLGYTDFLRWAASAKLDQFYDGERWDGWQSELLPVPPDHAISFYPPLWAAGPAPAGRSRRPVPALELFTFHVDTAKQLLDQR